MIYPVWKAACRCGLAGWGRLAWEEGGFEGWGVGGGKEGLDGDGGGEEGRALTGLVEGGGEEGHS